MPAVFGSPIICLFVLPNQPYVHSGSLLLASMPLLCLAVGLMSVAYPNLARRRHTNTHTHTHTQETPGCFDGVLGHLEQPEHENWRGSNTHPLTLITQPELFRDSLCASLNSLFNHTLEKTYFSKLLFRTKPQCSVKCTQKYALSLELTYWNLCSSTGLTQPC